MWDLAISLSVQTEEKAREDASPLLVGREAAREKSIAVVVSGALKREAL